VEVPAKCRTAVDLYFGSDLAPGGFAWVVPVFRGEREYARVGLMCESAAGAFFSRFLQRVAKRWELSEVPGTPRRKILPLSPIHKTYADRLLVVGDAAGLVKPTTGGGIYFSLISARFAADVLQQACLNQNFSEAQLQRYEHLWQSRLGPEIEAQLAIRHLAQRLPDSEIDEFFQLTRDRGVTRLIKTFARFNAHRDLILAVLRHPPTRDILQQAWQV
jgi:flavin-dependent dehydrogenase